MNCAHSLSVGIGAGGAGGAVIVKGIEKGGRPKGSNERLPEPTATKV